MPRCVQFTQMGVRCSRQACCASHPAGSTKCRYFCWQHCKSISGCTFNVGTSCTETVATKIRAVAARNAGHRVGPSVAAGAARARSRKRKPPRAARPRRRPRQPPKPRSIRAFLEQLATQLLFPAVTATVKRDLLRAMTECGNELLSKLATVRPLSNMDYVSSAIIAIKTIGAVDYVYDTMPRGWYGQMERLYGLGAKTLISHEGDVMNSVGWQVCPKFETRGRGAS